MGEPAVVPVRPALLALDIDGTLLDPALLDPVGVAPVVAHAVGAAVADGIHVALVTGRQSHAAAAFARALGLTRGWLSCTFGSVTVELDPAAPEGYRITRAITFDPRPVMADLARVSDVTVAIEEHARGFLVDRRWPDGELVEPQVEMGAREITATSSVMARSMRLTLDELAGVVDTTGLQCTAFRLRGASWINITPAGHTKRTGLEALAHGLGVDRRDVTAVGDDLADIDMLRWAGVGVAMGQASDEVKSAANRVTGSVTDHGAVDAVEWAIQQRRAAMDRRSPG